MHKKHPSATSSFGGCIADTNLFREHYPVFRSALSTCWSWQVAALDNSSMVWKTGPWIGIFQGFPMIFHEFLWFSMLFHAFEVFVSHPAERGHQCVLIAMLMSHRPYGIFPGLQVRQWRRGWQAVGQGCCGTSLCSIRPGNWCNFDLIFFFKKDSGRGVYFSWGGEPGSYGGVLPRLVFAKYWKNCVD